MTTEQFTADDDSVVVAGPTDGAPVDCCDYWHGHIPEKQAGVYLDVTSRKMQKWRQDGDGPPYIRLSARCVKYTRARLKRYADERLRTSTALQGSETGV